jgi:hypothetical protein
MHTLILCFGMYFGGCVQIRELEYPTLEACEHEREAQLRGPNPPYYAICRPGKAAR